MATFKELKAVKRRHAAELLKKDGVSGVDIDEDANGAPVIAVHLETDDPRVRRQLPNELEGHPLKFVHTGPIRKQAARGGS
ncbi:MAG: hypothetical protein ACREIT_11015 [Tepidisphaeraceae bacterium]